MVEGVWTVGVEREVTPGNYASLAAEIEGWTLWRFETRNGVYPIAAKPADGGRRHEPAGYAQALRGGSPSIRVSLHGGRTIAFIDGTHGEQIKAEFRVVGDRFMERVPMPLDPLPYDGKRLEVLVTSMPGPRSFTKVVEDHGIIDMTGLSAVIAARDAPT